MKLTWWIYDLLGSSVDISGEAVPVYELAPARILAQDPQDLRNISLMMDETVLPE